MRGVIGECSDNTKTGDAWYEEGSYPIISTTYGDEPAAFLRGMILPVEYDEYPDTAMWIEGRKEGPKFMEELLSASHHAQIVKEYKDEESKKEVKP